jgi:hypothetical protein
MSVGHVLPWWAWLLVAWLAADAVFVIAWTMRARVRERDAVEPRFPGGQIADDLTPLDDLTRLDELAPRPIAANRRSRTAP